MVPWPDAIAEYDTANLIAEPYAAHAVTHTYAFYSESDTAVV